MFSGYLFEVIVRGGYRVNKILLPGIPILTRYGSPWRGFLIQNCNEAVTNIFTSNYSLIGFVGN